MHIITGLGQISFKCSQLQITWPSFKYIWITSKSNIESTAPCTKKMEAAPKSSKNILDIDVLVLCSSEVEVMVILLSMEGCFRGIATACTLHFDSKQRCRGTVQVIGNNRFQSAVLCLKGPYVICAFPELIDHLLELNKAS